MKYRALRARIQSELAQVERALPAVHGAMKRARDASVSSQDQLYYLAAAALGIASIYNGIENIFRVIAETLDGHLPRGEFWHKDLLRQMTVEIPEVRPAVIRGQTARMLEELLSFRHKVRNMYVFDLIYEKMQPVYDLLPGAWEAVRTDLLEFMRFLEELQQA